MGELVIIKGRMVTSPGVRGYRGLPRLRVSWVPKWLRLDVFGHGVWIDARGPSTKLGAW